MSDGRPIADERIRRFERLGGVDLRNLSEGDRAEVETGIAHLKRALFHFHCSVCGNRATNDQELEPLCTGPNWTDDHEPTVMEFVR